jgi:uncharacterized SAM-binding protein YcdF (DUF218 family)
LARDVIRELDAELTIYYCIDDLASSSPAAKRISRSESQLFREADLVFVTSEKLRQRASRYNDQVHLFPFGVDFVKFEQVRQSSDTIPTELQQMSRPVVGYVGGLHRWVDQKLLANVVRGMPDASFVFVGPLQTETSELARAPNVHLLGARPHEAVPRYIKGFDVGIVPYCSSEYTDHVYPTKLNEYLAMGIPVVATPLPEVARFNAQHGDIVGIAHDPLTFEAAIREAIRTGSARLTEQRIAVARHNSWESRIAMMSALIEQQMSAREATEEGWVTSLKQIYRRAHRRLFAPLMTMLAVYLLLFHTPCLWWVAKPLLVAEPPRPADAIVVLAGGVGESGKAGGGYQERVKHAVDLYRSGFAAQLILSSGYTFVFEESKVMQALAIAQGVPASAIFLEDQAANTCEHALFVRERLHQRQWRQILLVSSPYHMRRAVATFNKLAPEITVIPQPPPRSQFYAHARGSNLDQIWGILHEYVSLVYYWLKGWV